MRLWLTLVAGLAAAGCGNQVTTGHGLDGGGDGAGCPPGGGSAVID